MLLELDVEETEAERWLEDIADRLEQPHTMLQLLGEQLSEYEQELFASNGNGQWAPLDPATAAEKGSTRILVDHGDLLDALTGGVDLEGDSVSTTGVPSYAKYLKIGARGMPKRDPAPEPPAHTTERWAEDLLAFLVGRGHTRGL